FNLLILAMLDIRNPAPLSASIHQGHVLAGGFGLIQLGLAALAMAAGSYGPMVGWVGVQSFVFLGLYGFAARLVFKYERGRISELAEEIAGEDLEDTMSLRGAVIRYSAAAALLVAAAAYLPAAAEGLAEVTGLGRSFVGSLFVAASTSLPEIVVSLAAARLGALDMAAANLFGSNIFNVAVLGVDDLLYTRGSLLVDIEPVHLVTLVSAMMMTAVAVIGLTYRAQKKRFRLSWDTFFIVGIYAAGTWLLWQMQ
ncbi:MAG TPA: hypothetical protein VLA20_09595, partial [Vicinamibacterales bacterium]|nr:hypothetical protein [Vicinamibacterales bacterium]